MEYWRLTLKLRLLRYSCSIVLKCFEGSTFFIPYPFRARAACFKGRMLYSSVLFILSRLFLPSPFPAKVPNGSHLGQIIYRSSTNHSHLMIYCRFFRTDIYIFPWYVWCSLRCRVAGKYSSWSRTSFPSWICTVHGSCTAPQDGKLGYIWSSDLPDWSDIYDLSDMSDVSDLSGRPDLSGLAGLSDL